MENAPLMCLDSWGWSAMGRISRTRVSCGSISTCIRSLKTPSSFWFQKSNAMQEVDAGSPRLSVKESSRLALPLRQFVRPSTGIQDPVGYLWCGRACSPRN